MPGVNIAFVDIEASGLHWGSYPIEFGWATPSAELNSTSFLLKPAPAWGENLWALEAEIIHGISRSELDANGVPVRLAARRLNRELSGMKLYSDNAEFDSYWTARLFEESGEVQNFTILPAQDLFLDTAIEAVGGNSKQAIELVAVASEACRHVYPHTHRAAPDAVHLAATYRYIADEVFRGGIDRQLEAILELQFRLFDGFAIDAPAEDRNAPIT